MIACPFEPDCTDPVHAVKVPGVTSTGSLQALAAELAPWRCCGSPSLCGADCQDDELSDTLARAERVVRAALEAES